MTTWKYTHSGCTQSEENQVNQFQMKFKCRTIAGGTDQDLDKYTTCDAVQDKKLENLDRHAMT